MTRVFRILMQSSLAAAVGLAAMSWSGDLPAPWNGHKPFTAPELMSTAHAVIGRPLTPMSYAGVARRTTRRAVAVGAGAAAAGAYAVRPGCVQAANAYGQIVTRCY
jgi:hypothetical protein